MRILHGPVNVGNQPWALSRAERNLGAASDLVVRSETWLRYQADVTLASRNSRFIETALRSAAFALSGQWRYDVLHFYFGQTFLSPGFALSKQPFIDEALGNLTTLDLRLARLLGRKLFMTLQGCDVRLAGDGNRRNEWTMCAPQHCALYGKCISELDARRRYLMRTVLPLFDRVFYLNPELGHLVPEGRFLPYANADIDKLQVVPPTERRTPRIVHAPSDPSIKGTSLILRALKALRSTYDFELILVENRTHEEALEIYRSADIAIDQVLAGWYGGFAVEMMALGKPVACYIREGDMKFVPEAMRRELPLFRLDPGNLAGGLAELLERRSDWVALGQRSRKYVERWHDPNRIAKAMLQAYAAPDSSFELGEP